MSNLSYFLFVILFILSACDDSKNAARINNARYSSQKSSSLESKTEIVQTPEDLLLKALSKNKTEIVQTQDGCFKRKTREEKFSCLYERFNYESVLCSKLEKLVIEKELVQRLKKDFYSPDGGIKQLIMFLNGPLREDPDVLYLLANPAYFEIDIDYHYSPLGKVYIGETDIYCAQTMKRLHELEYLGRSDLVWPAREKWLDHYFAVMDMPWSEMASVSNEYFFIEFERVKQVYNSAEDKKRLRRWIDNAEKILFQKAEKESIEGSAGRTKEQHLEMLRLWVKQMRQRL